MSSRITVFVGGVHGVGKSSVSSKLALAIKGQHQSAGELISRGRPHAAGEKRVAGVADNQSLLLESIHSLPEDGYVLDGHFCVVGAGHEIQRIPVETFKSIAPAVVVVMRDEPASIRERLLRRDGTAFTTDTIAALQAAELSHADYVCRILSVPMRAFHTGEIDAATVFLRQHIGDNCLWGFSSTQTSSFTGKRAQWCAETLVCFSTGLTDYTGRSAFTLSRQVRSGSTATPRSSPPLTPS